MNDKKIVAIACSTGGPRALQQVIPFLPAGLAAPVLIVQHMPAGFTEALALRLDAISPLPVKEAAEGDILREGRVYLAKGGRHMLTGRRGKDDVIRYSDEPAREGVRPSANNLYESLEKSSYEEVICVIMTGMGADGTAGISHLRQKKKVTVIAQDEATSTVYGMPRSVIREGLAGKIVPLEKIAGEIIKNVGVK